MSETITAPTEVHKEKGDILQADSCCGSRQEREIICFAAHYPGRRLMLR